MILFVMMLLISSSVFAADARYLLNSAPLKPTITNFAPCDNAVHRTLVQITNNSMSTYEKVKACYDYLINTCSYGNKVRNYTFVDGVLSNSSYRITLDDFNNNRGPYNAYVMLEEHVGVCDDYSCAFAALVRAIGLNCYTIGGLTSKASGGMTPHLWTVIKINGKEYVFDPQIDDNIAKGGRIGYYRFCKTYAEVSGSYSDYSISYHHFKPFN